MWHDSIGRLVSCGLVVCLAPAAFAVPTGAPYLLGDVRPGAPGSRDAEAGASVATLGRHVLFAADDGSVGRELWRTDGSAAGTTLVRDVAPGPAGSDPSDFVTIPGAVLFRAVLDGEVALWRTDGTPAGTIEVKRFGRLDEGRDVVPLLGGSRALLVANDGVSGREPWGSNGTEAGTVLLRDVHPGPDGSSPGPRRDVAAIADTLFFTAADAAGARGLWRTNGTVAGTAPVMPAASGMTPSRLVGAAATVHFRADVDGDVQLWRSNGTEASTLAVRSFGTSAAGAFIDGLVNAGDAVVFAAAESGGAPEVWTTDGTPAGTYAFAGGDLVPPVAASELAGRVLLATAGALWTSDRTTEGTRLLKSLAPGSLPSPLLPVGDRVYFGASDDAGPGLWRTDGSSAGTVLVRRFAAPLAGLVDAGGALVLFADDQAHGVEPWTMSACGDGVAADDEQCDDGNGFAYDGCAACRLEEWVAGTGTLSSDDPADGAHPADPLETTVTGAGDLAIVESFGEAPLAGVARLGVEVDVAAAPATIVSPLAVRLRLDPAAFEGEASELVVLRDGVRVAECAGASGVAEPDPCVAASRVMPDGDLEVDTLASSGGTWGFGRVGCAPRPVPTCVEPASSKLASVTRDSGTRIAWSWKGPRPDELPAPEHHDHAVCVYAGSGPDASLVTELVVPRAATCGGASCWKAGKGGLGFVDGARRFGGVKVLRLAHAGRVTLKVAAAPLAALADASLPWSVQLQSNGGACWGGAFSLAGASVVVPDRVRAKADPCDGCVVDRNGDGQTVLACVGDSNTDPDGPAIGAPKWCQLVAAAEPAWLVRDISLYGTTAWPRPRYYPFSGRTLLAQALSASPPPDVVVIALGANDLLNGRSPLQLRDALAELLAQAAGTATWVALVTPDFGTATPERVVAANSMLAGLRTIDFFSGMVRADMCADGLHVCASGQQLMAARALAALRR